MSTLLVLIAVGTGISAAVGFGLASMMFERGTGRVAAAVVFTLLAVVAMIAIVIAGCARSFHA